MKFEKLNSEQKKELSSSTWLAPIGAILIVGGIMALIASNWVKIPFVVQILISVAPLTIGWVCYGVMLKKKISSSVWHEVLSIVWGGGGVVCSIALLGRILQYSSSEFIFCATVSLLIAPVYCAVRSNTAWFLMLGFAIYGANDSSGSNSLSLLTVLSQIGLLMFVAGMTTLKLRVKMQGNESAIKPGYRLIGFSATIWTMILGIKISTLFKLVFDLNIDTYGYVSMFISLISAGILLLFGAIFEDKNKVDSRVITKLSSGICCFLYLISATTFEDGCSCITSSVFAMFSAIFVMILCRYRRKIFICEGLFLMLIPIAIINLIVGIQSLSLSLGLAIGVVVMVTGIIQGRRKIANEGFIFTIIDAFVFFIQSDMSLFMQGVFLILSGFGIVAINMFLTRRNMKGELK